MRKGEMKGSNYSSMGILMVDCAVPNAEVAQGYLWSDSNGSLTDESLVEGVQYPFTFKNIYETEPKMIIGWKEVETLFGFSQVNGIGIETYFTLQTNTGCKIGFFPKFGGISVFSVSILIIDNSFENVYVYLYDGSLFETDVKGSFIQEIEIDPLEAKLAASQMNSVQVIGINWLQIEAPESAQVDIKFVAMRVSQQKYSVLLYVFKDNTYTIFNPYVMIINTEPYKSDQSQQALILSNYFQFDQQQLQGQLESFSPYNFFPIPSHTYWFQLDEFQASSSDIMSISYSNMKQNCESQFKLYSNCQLQYARFTYLAFFQANCQNSQSSVQAGLIVAIVVLSLLFLSLGVVIVIFRHKFRTCCSSTNGSRPVQNLKNEVAKGQLTLQTMQNLN